MEDIINKAVLFDYFSGRISPLQKKSVETWLAAPDSRDQYYQWLHEWEVSHLQTSVRWEEAFAQTTQRVSSTPPTIHCSDKTANRWQRHRTGQWLVAASVVLMLGVGGWFNRDGLLYQTVRTGFGEMRSLTLPDGSAVTLNANSSLRFPRTAFGLAPFGQEARTVSLTGEADFSVRHLPTHQRFVVQTPKGLTVTVLGTQFTVLSRERNTRVALRSGRVELRLGKQTGHAPLTMRPGDLVTLDNRGKLALRQTPHPEALSAWKQHRFTFEQTSLREIADILNENYGLTVTIASAELANRTISGSFPARNANEVVQMVAELLQINYHRDDNRILFTN